MHISAISSSYAQIMKALVYSKAEEKDNKSVASSAVSMQNKCLHTAQLYDAISEWQRFCHQQLLKTHLDITI